MFHFIPHCRFSKKSGSANGHFIFRILKNCQSA
jgi:hypothetical protein